MSLLEQAISFAGKKHSGQTRKSFPVPYIVHPMEVMYAVAKLGITDEKVLIGAVLHDLYEDTETSSHEVIELFGEDVHKLVDELSLYGSQPEDKKNYLLSFSAKSIDALLIKMVDRTCNVKDYVAAGNWKYALKYFNKALVLEDTFKRRYLELGDKGDKLYYLWFDTKYLVEDKDQEYEGW